MVQRHKCSQMHKKALQPTQCLPDAEKLLVQYSSSIFVSNSASSELVGETIERRSTAL